MRYNRKHSFDVLYFRTGKTNYEAECAQLSSKRFSHYTVLNETVMTLPLKKVKFKR